MWSKRKIKSTVKKSPSSGWVQNAVMGLVFLCVQAVFSKTAYLVISALIFNALFALVVCFFKLPPKQKWMAFGCFTLLLWVIVGLFIRAQVGPAGSPLEVMAMLQPGEYPLGGTVGQLKWASGMTDLRLVLHNPGDVDYDDVDVVVEPSSPIVHIEQRSTVPGVVFIGDVTKEVVDIGGVIAMSPNLLLTNQMGSSAIPLRQLATPRYRIRCQRIPKHASVEIMVVTADIDQERTSPAPILLAPADYNGDTSQPPVILGGISTVVTYRQNRPTTVKVKGAYLRL